MCKMATVTPIFAEVERKAERAEIFKQDHKASTWQIRDSNAVTVCLLKPPLFSLKLCSEERTED